MFEISGFENYAKEATVNIRALACSFMVNRNNVSALIGDDIGNAAKLTGFIHKFNKKIVVAT
jgi:hypothetical protein